MRKALLIPLLSMLVCWAWGQSYSYRYWIDNNVGSAATGSGTGETEFNVNTATLTSGMHAVHVQAKDASNLWSSVYTRYFMVYATPSQTAANARYWIDNDLRTMHNNVATNGVIDVDISTLKVGLHSIHYQKIATDGTPSSAFTRYFMVYTSPNQTAATARYWIDNDLKTMHNGVATSGIIDLDISNLKKGLHCVHYQKITSDGTPSSVFTRYFYVDREQQGGYSAAISIDDGEAKLYDITGEDIVIDLGELTGEHQLHVVIYDAAKNVMDTQTHTFMATPPVEEKVIELTEAGTLSEHITSTDESWLKELTITGPLNSTDFKLLRSMAGNNNLGEPTDGKLVKLDLSGATIVTGGENYLDELAIEKNDELGKQVFKGCNLQEIVLPKGLLGIDDRAFEGCTALTDVISYIQKPFDFDRSAFCLTQDGDFTSAKLTVPYNTKAAYQQAEGWKYFTTITEMSAEETNIDFVDANVKSVCVENWDTNDDGELNYAEAAAVSSLGTVFKGTEITNFDELKYFTGLTSIGDTAFASCNKLASIIIPRGVTTVGGALFSYCDSLTSVKVDEENSKLDSRNDCNAIIETASGTLLAGCKTTVIPDDVTAIGDMAFYHVSGLTDLVLPQGLESIGYCSLFGLKDQVSLVIPKSVTNIASEAFGSMSALESLVVEEGNTVYDSRDSCNAVIETATNMLIAGCKTTVIPETVTSIEDYAFRACDGLREIALPESVKAIGTNSFENCDSLITVTSYAKQALAIGENTFTNRANAILYVPYGCKSDYEAADYWKEFKSIMEMERVKSPDIAFADELTKEYCVYYWDTDGDNELSEDEAAAVETIGTVFQESEITSFDELRYFTGLTEIDQMAFASCDQMQSITIPRGVTTVGGGLFYFCDALTSVRVDDANPVLESPENSNAIIERSSKTLLAGCTTTVIPDNVTAIGDLAFYHVHGLSDLKLPQGLRSIGFAGLFGLMDQKSIVIPKSVTEIGSEAFGNMNALENLTVEEGNMVYDSRGGCNAVIETATNKLISGCKTTIIPTTVTAIDYCAFDSQPITELYIPANVTAVDELAIRLCSSLSSITVASGNSVYDSHDGCNAIIETATGKLLLGCLTTVIPEGTKTIARYAFYGYSDLTEVSIPNSVTEIGDKAFSDCDGLKEVYCYAENVPGTGKNAFQDASISSATLYVPAISLETYKAAEPWSGFGAIKPLSEEIPEYSELYYEYDDSLKQATVISGKTRYSGSVMIPKSVTHDGITYNVTAIGGKAFYACKELTKVIIPNSVTSIGNRAFFGCDNLTEVIIGNSVTEIGDSAFNACKSLIEVNIPNSVTAIGAYAFNDCFALKSVTIPNSVTEIRDYTFYFCSALTSVTIPNSVTSIGVYAFGRCTGLTEVTIPKGVTSIGNRAFAFCSNLTSVTIPGRAKEIGDYVFYLCSKIKEVYCYAKDVPNTGSTAFSNVPISSATLHVPETSVEAYKATAPWSGFRYFVALPKGPRGDVDGDGKVDMDDATFVTNIILGIEDETEEADINKDGEINMSDLMFIVNYIKKGKFPDE